LLDRIAAADAVGKMADGERVGFRRVVAHDHAEISDDQECRPARAGRDQERGLIGRAREWLGAGAAQAEPLPLGKRLPDRAVGEQEIEVLRQYDLIAPGRARLPAGALQVVRGRADHVGNGIDHVAPPVAVEVDGEALERGRHELGRAEGAGPGALEIGRRHVATFENLECRQEFVAEIALPPADAGERRGRAQHRPLAGQRAKFRFDAPDRRDYVAIGAVRLLGRIEHGAVPGDHLAAGLNALVADQEVEILPHRPRELRLRIEQLHDLELGLEAAGGELEGAHRNAALLRQRPKRGEASPEIGGGRQDRLGRHQRMHRSLRERGRDEREHCTAQDHRKLGAPASHRSRPLPF
jgi:hypothetical protein